ncbi:hypothetical protein DCAR_0728750 [Daucus carota subsp. sativus]|uniref:Uncharacterized protein n=1 Tax=Daucus carota subsp. sativus TaxID=79200 RepID=A0A164TTN9_DAUCS|nr:hypothetical protein DCAR_0728750 [Daucus carota subsp. sativus]
MPMAHMHLVDMVILSGVLRMALMVRGPHGAPVSVPIGQSASAVAAYANQGYMTMVEKMGTSEMQSGGL